MDDVITVPKWKLEEWNDHQVRFVELYPHKWWAVLTDVAAALGLHNHEVTDMVEKDNLSRVTLQFDGDAQEVTIISEIAIYTLLAETGGGTP